MRGLDQLGQFAVREILPLVIVVLVFVGLLTFNRRNRDRTARADAQRRSALHPGSSVMTTSGLYATVVGIDLDADTAVLSVAPGVEVTWAIAALREREELPDRYRAPLDPAAGGRAATFDPAGRDATAIDPDTK